MAIVDVQRRLAEVGRIRIGQQVEASNGKQRPSKLDTLRLTSADKRRIEQAAELYGGEVEAWEAPSGQQWQVVTETADVPVVVPPTDMCFSQFYELWSRGGCQRRCDGVIEQLSDGPCKCDPDQRECSPHTRLSVMLRDLPGLGLWRLDTQGYYAMNELAGAVELIHMAAGKGALLPARLRVEQRQVVRPGERGPETRNFPVPVIDVEMTAAELVAGAPEAMGLPEARQALESGEAPFTPVPAEAQQHEPAPSVADQLDRDGERGSRRRSAEPIPDPGLPDEQPATAEQRNEFETIVDALDADKRKRTNDWLERNYKVDLDGFANLSESWAEKVLSYLRTPNEEAAS